MNDPRPSRPSVPEPAEPRDGAGGHGDPRRVAGSGDRLWSAFDEATREAAADRDAGAHARECLEWCPICRGADVVRATATPEMRDQWQAIQRDALVAVRALLDGYIERIERDRRGEARVEDIPID